MTIRSATRADEDTVLTLFEELFDPPARRPRDYTRERGCTHLELNSAVTRKDAHRFYLANGMTQTSLNFGCEIER